VNPWIVKNLIYFPIQAFRGERVREYMDEIRAFHEKPLSRKLDIQWNKLQDLLQYVYANNAYYRDLFDKNGIDVRKIDSPEEFRQIPFLTKDAIRSDSQAMRSTYSGRVSARSTSGSTGIPLSFVKDRDSTAYMDALMYEVYGWHGIGIGDRQSRLWGVPFSPRGRLMTRLKDILLNRRRLSAFSISPQECSDYLQKLKRFRPKFMYGLPSTMCAFADSLHDRGVEPSEAGLEVIISTGEILTDRRREKLESAFECHVVNEYGTTENGIVAFQSQDGTMRLMIHNLYIEILNPDDGTPAKPGETGEIVLTELHSHAMPFIRYRVGDMAVPEEARPNDEGLPTVRNIVGRLSDLVVTPEGNRVAAAILDYTLAGGIRRFKAFQDSVDLLHVMIEADDSFDRGALAETEASWREYLGDSIRIEFEIVDNIPPDKSGKMTVLESTVNSADNT